MPCYDDRRDDNTDLRGEAREATRAACELAKVLRQVVPKQWSALLSRRTIVWIGAHDAEDAARIRREAEAKAKTAAKYEVLKKLTPQERKLLDL